MRRICSPPELGALQLAARAGRRDAPRVIHHDGYITVGLGCSLLAVGSGSPLSGVKEFRHRDRLVGQEAQLEGVPQVIVRSHVDVGRRVALGHLAGEVGAEAKLRLNLRQPGLQQGNMRRDVRRRRRLRLSDCVLELRDQSSGPVVHLTGGSDDSLEMRDWTGTSAVPDARSEHQR